MSKNNDKKTSKNIIEKHSQKLRDHAKQSATDVFKAASEMIIHKQQKQLVYWLVRKIAYKI